MENFLETTDYLAKMQLALADIARYPLGIESDTSLRHARHYLEDLSTIGHYNSLAEKHIPNLMEHLGHFIAHPSAIQYLKLSKALCAYQDDWQELLEYCQERGKQATDER